MTRIDLGVFDRAWDRLEAWLAEHSPADYAALQPPATAAEIEALEARLGFGLHPELRALLERHNGVAEKQPSRDRNAFQAGAFLPLGHRLSRTDRIASTHRMLVGFGEDSKEAGFWDEDYLNGHPHQWVPFAHPNDGGVAFIDHRPGPAYGRVYEIGIGSGDVDGSEWSPGLGRLFAELADSLEAGTPFKHFWPTTYEHSSGAHCVDWDIRT